MTFSTRELRKGITWKGVALCALFSVTKDMANPNDIIDSFYKLICHLKASNGLILEPPHIYWPTEKDLRLLLLGGLTWLFYITHLLFSDNIKVSFTTNCHGLKVQKCGLCLLNQDSMKLLTNLVDSELDSLGIINEKKTENRSRKMMSWIQNELSQNDPLVINNYVVFLSQTRY